MGQALPTDIYTTLSNDLYTEAGCMWHPSNLLQINYD